ncbi:MAG: endonuclease domain-containing protein [Candidatus Paceibacterota bacterium]
MPKGRGGDLLNLELPPPTPSLKRRGVKIQNTMKTIHNIKKLFYRRKELRNNSTPQEILLWLKLKNSQLGFKFRRQHSIGGYIADFYCPSKKLVIEIDGSQHFKEEAKKYDDIRSNYFEGLDIKVLRFTNGEINTNMSGVLLKIITQLSKK